MEITDVRNQAYVVFYRNSCAKCRVLSLMAVILSLGILKRRPVDDQYAQLLYYRYPESRGKFLLVLNRKVIFGKRVFAYVFLVIPYWLVGVH